MSQNSTVTFSFTIYETYDTTLDVGRRGTARRMDYLTRVASSYQKWYGGVASSKKFDEE